MNGFKLLIKDGPRDWPEGVVGVDGGEETQQDQVAPPDQGVAQQIDPVILCGTEPLPSEGTVRNF
jgi:hypothetical protein